MKTITSNRAFALFFVVTILIAMTLPLSPKAGAATRTKANNTTNLNLTGSWSGGVVPGSGDIALWDSTVTGANTVSLGADLNFGEMQITNPGGGVTINAGNTLTLSGVSGVGIDMSSATQNLLLNCAITLGAAQTWNVASGRTLTVGTVNNGGNLLTITGAASTSIGGVISGAGGLTYTGAFSQGFLFLSVAANTYTGVTTLDGGQTVVNALANVNVASSIGKGSVAGSAADLVFGGGVLLYLPSASGPTSTNRLFTLGDANGLTASISTGDSNAASTMSFTNTGAIAFGGSGARTLTLTGVNTGNNTFAPILGDGPGGATSLGKFGNGTWIITGANTYTGTTQVWNGTLTVNSGGTIGASTSTLDVSSFFNTPVVLNLNVDQTVGRLQGSISGTGTATINIASTKTLTSNQSSNTTYAGVIAGAGALTKSGSGTLILSGNNSYSGATTINAGALNIQNANALGNTTLGTAVASGAALQIQGGITTAAEALTLNGTGVSNDGALRNISGTNLYAGAITLGSTARINSDSGTLQLDVASGNAITGTQNLTFGGNGGVNVNDPIATGTGTLTKDGAGLLNLGGANTYSGGTSVTGGTLLVTNGTGSGTGTGSVTVNNSGTTLSGGTNTGVGGISGAVNINPSASLSPGSVGNGVGSTSILKTGALTLASTSNFKLDLNNTTAGTGYDQLGVTGTVNVSGSNLVVTAGGGLTIGNKFFIVLNDGTDLVTGTFAQGTTVTAGNNGDMFLINYLDNGDGGTVFNDISLTFTGVPEPSTWVAGALTCGLLGWSQRRRFRRVIKRAEARS